MTPLRWARLCFLAAPLLILALALFGCGLIEPTTEVNVHDGGTAVVQSGDGAKTAGAPSPTAPNLQQIVQEAQR